MYTNKYPTSTPCALVTQNTTGYGKVYRKWYMEGYINNILIHINTIYNTLIINIIIEYLSSLLILMYPYFKPLSFSYLFTHFQSAGCTVFYYDKSIGVFRVHHQIKTQTSK